MRNETLIPQPLSRRERGEQSENFWSFPPLLLGEGLGGEVNNSGKIKL